jgi:nitroreductase
MNLKELVLKGRSIRRYGEDEIIPEQVVIDLLELARNCPSSRNDQPLKFIYSVQKKINNLVFPCLKWAGYLTDWNGPVMGERPAAYIIVLGDQNISNNFECDAGIAMQTIVLGAAEKNLGTCIIASVDRPQIRKILDVPDQYEILYIISIGYPAETVILEETGKDGNIKYWRDENGVHHVPKRPLNEIILNIPNEFMEKLSEDN